MYRITAHQPHPLFDCAATRRIERAAAADLPAQALMQRAGLAAARLALALAPHARLVWLACGPGNNGGDGLEAAVQLRRAGRQVLVTWLGRPDRAPADARAAWLRAQAAGLQWADGAIDAERLDACDLCVDALLGLGVRSGAAAPARAPDARLLACLRALRHSRAPVLALDLPSGLDADTGQFAAGLAPDGNDNDGNDGDGDGNAPAVFPCAAAGAQRLEPEQARAMVETGTGAPVRGGPVDSRGRPAPGPCGHAPAPLRHTLSLLSLKPGLFTGVGRDAAGQVWFDDLGVQPGPGEAPSAWLIGPAARPERAHASHKGSYGDVAVIGGEGLAVRGMGMCGAAWLAASAALHAGAGRVLLALLDSGAMQCALQQPELMLRRFDALALERLTVVCGCGGGAAVAALLPEVIARAARLVLDADALNHIAADGALQAQLLARTRAPRPRPTVLTPHPLEAARLLGLSAAQVQADRLAAARQLAARLHCVTVLKGSGSVIAAPGQASAINPTGNARLATAGSGDVLAGMIAARLAAGAIALHAASQAVYAHGLIADHWPPGQTLTAGALARRAGA